MRKVVEIIAHLGRLDELWIKGSMSSKILWGEMKV
jgi:hypothetical protein